MQRFRFPVGQQPEVKVADLCKHVNRGDCPKCPGIADGGELRPELAGEWVFCTCQCHMRGNHDRRTDE